MESSQPAPVPGVRGPRKHNGNRPVLAPPYNFYPFLNPPHYHDTKDLESLLTIPREVASSLDPKQEEALDDLLESTSIAYASLLRLEDLLSARFHRLLQDKDPAHWRTTYNDFSETAFFNYDNTLRAEHHYLTNEVKGDWRGKELRARHLLRPLVSTPLPGTDETLRDWLQNLSVSTENWFHYANSVELLDFEHTVVAFLTSQSESFTITPMTTHITPSEITEQFEAGAVDIKIHSSSPCLDLALEGSNEFAPKEDMWSKLEDKMFRSAVQDLTEVEKNLALR